MITLPFIRQDDGSSLTPIERSMIGLDSMITSLMMQGTINDPKASAEEIETFMTLSVAATIPAEA